MSGIGGRGRPRALRVAVVVFLAVVPALLAGCATNPATGKKELSLVSPQQERQIGEEGQGAILAEYGRYDDARLAAYVDSVGKAVARVSHLPDLDWSFTLLDDPAVNAFAMPGGYIYVTRGILAHLNSEAQLAGVLGHEVGHVTARHTAQRMTQQQIAGLGLGVAAMFSASVRRYSDAAQTALGLMFLKYGRDDESQADALGIEYAVAAGYDPRVVPSTYAMLKRVGEREGQRLPEFLSTHPDPGNREQRTTELAATAAAGRAGLRVAGGEYLARVDGVLYGRDPRGGYFDGDAYFNPRLAIQLTLPAGWKHQDTRLAMVSTQPEQRAAFSAGLAKPAGATPREHAQSMVATGRISDLSGQDERIGGAPAWVGHVIAAGGQGGSRTLVAAWVQRGPDRLYEFLGRSQAPGDADEQAILASIRSLRELTDRARLAPDLERIAVVRAPDAGALGGVLPKLGPQSVDAEETGLLNNLRPDSLIARGRPLKIVREVPPAR